MSRHRAGRHGRGLGATSKILTSGAFAVVPLVAAGCGSASEPTAGEPGPASASVPAPAQAAPQAQPPAPVLASERYTVRSGDTLSSIAAGKGMSWKSLWEANRATVADPSAIRSGTTLTIPAQPSAGSSGDRTSAAPRTTKPTTTKPTTTKPTTPKPDAARSGAARADAGKPKPAPAKPLAAGRQQRIELTGYSWHDNTPAGSAEVSSPILHKEAGGQGTFADPITVAVAGSGKNAAVKPGTKYYLPSVKRYVIVEDTGASSASNGGTHLDMWIDGRSGSKSATDSCMNQITGTVNAELNPPAGRPVIPGPIFNNGRCNIPKGSD